MDYTITIKTWRRDGPGDGGDISGPYVLYFDPVIPGASERTVAGNFDSFLVHLLRNLECIEQQGGNAFVNWQGKTYGSRDSNANKEETREAKLERTLNECFQPKVPLVLE